MRIATWNMEREGRGQAHSEAYDAALASYASDLAVVTEPGPNFVLRYVDAVMSSAQRVGKSGPESWVAIVGASLAPMDIEIPYSRLAAAAFTEAFGPPVAIYGSILPWNAAATQAPDVYGRDVLPFSEFFDRALQEQVSDIKAIAAEFGPGNVFWAGDFNHPLEGSLRGFAAHARKAIAVALDDLGMRAFNASAPHAKPCANSVDLICGPVNLSSNGVEDWLPTADGRPLSDHRAYCVEVGWSV